MYITYTVWLKNRDHLGVRFSKLFFNTRTTLGKKIIKNKKILKLNLSTANFHLATIRRLCCIYKKIIYKVAIFSFPGVTPTEDKSQQYVSDFLERYVFDSDTDSEGRRFPVVKPYNRHKYDVLNPVLCYFFCYSFLTPLYILE